MSRQPSVRLGGMALANGVLVHGPRHWSCAVRTDEGELKVASGLKPVRAADVTLFPYTTLFRSDRKSVV